MFGEAWGGFFASLKVFQHTEGVKKLQGELKTLGIEKKGVGLLTDEVIKFTNTFEGRVQTRC